MSLRPRYSLLALLLFTVVVAGGVKIWRGPHRVAMSEPPTAYEDKLLSYSAMNWVHVAYFNPAAYEYDYLQTGNGPECLTVTGRTTDGIPILVTPTDFPAQWQLQKAKALKPAPKPAAAQSPAALDEYVICWVYRGQPKASPASKLENPAGIATIMVPKQRCYYVTNQRQVYTDTVALAAGVYVKRVELPELSDEFVRDRIAEIIATLPR